MMASPLVCIFIFYIPVNTSDSPISCSLVPSVDDTVSVHEDEEDTNAAEEMERLVPHNAATDDQDPK